MKRDVVKYGNDALRVKALPVEIVDEDIRTLASDMLETMYANSGVGLAAEQVGRTEAIFVIDVSPPPGSNHEDDYEDEEPENPGVPMPMVLINPEVLSSDAGQETVQEGCLSFPRYLQTLRDRQRSRWRTRTWRAAGTQSQQVDCSPAPYSMRWIT